MNNSVELVVFDLDGTLVKSDQTIFNTMRLALDKIGVKDELNNELFANAIGHHFKDMFDAMNVVVERYDEFVTNYKSHYFDFIDQSILYPNAEMILKWLKSNNIKVALLTTKLQDQADQIIDHFELRKYFDEVTGRRAGVGHKPDPEPLLKICNLLNVKPKNTLMVGDTELDIRCAKNAKTFSCAVSFGFRTIKHLENEEPDYLINDLSELVNIINQPKEVE
jgi:HAD superfamily hydrolase (TIGR01549 family)